MKNMISFLLGAGFSAPKGYPTGTQLNNKVQNCKLDDFSFHSSGTLYSGSNGNKFAYRSEFDKEYEFCLELIKYFVEKNQTFDYEIFYDFIKKGAFNDNNVKSIALRIKGQKRDASQLLYGLSAIYSQIIAYFLVDMNEKGWYDDASWVSGPYYPGYTGILNYFSKLRKTHILKIHTLNHDLFFERLNMTDWLGGELSDGFEEMGSPFYGDLNVKGRTYKVRLSRFTNRYTNNIHLYKLHGSRDYVLYYKSKGSNAIPENYIKTRYGIGYSSIFKETCCGKGIFKYDDCWVNYHADFLTGASSKLDRYKEPLLYKKLFDSFRRNLISSEQLVIIGYGCKDHEINKIITECFDYKNKSCIIIDPFPSKVVINFAKLLNSKIITEHLQTIKL